MSRGESNNSGKLVVEARQALSELINRVGGDGHETAMHWASPLLQDAKIELRSGRPGSVQRALNLAGSVNLAEEGGDLARVHEAVVSNLRQLVHLENERAKGTGR